MSEQTSPLARPTADRLTHLQDALLALHVRCNTLPVHEEDQSEEADEYRGRIARIQFLLTEATVEAVNAATLARKIEFEYPAPTFWPAGAQSQTMPLASMAA